MRNQRNNFVAGSLVLAAFFSFVFNFAGCTWEDTNKPTNFEIGCLSDQACSDGDDATYDYCAYNSETGTSCVNPDIFKVMIHDLDGDGILAEANSTEACQNANVSQDSMSACKVFVEVHVVTAGLTWNDCNDTRSDIYPGAPELCDGVDNDCDNVVDEGCVTPECSDGEGQIRSCGLNDMGAQLRVCVDGHWGEYGACSDPDICVNGAVSTQNCGLNGRGSQARVCANGNWGEYGSCSDPDECLDGSTNSRSCGLNGAGFETRICQNGHWGNYGVCSDPDVCVNGIYNQTTLEFCIDGQWETPTCSYDADCDSFADGFGFMAETFVDDNTTCTGDSACAAHQYCDSSIEVGGHCAVDFWWNGSEQYGCVTNFCGTCLDVDGDGVCDGQAPSDEGTADCSDGIDNDNDSLIDCADPGCTTAEACQESTLSACLPGMTPWTEGPALWNQCLTLPGSACYDGGGNSVVCGPGVSSCQNNSNAAWKLAVCGVSGKNVATVSFFAGVVVYDESTGDAWGCRDGGTYCL